MTTIRAFLALDLPDEVRARLASWSEAARRLDWPARIRWVPAENLHLTLRFMGRLDVDQIPPFAQALEERFQDVPAFDWRLEGPILFPSEKRPHVLAAKVTHSDPLETLARFAEEAASAVGQPPDSRRFQPHLTLGRMRRPRNGRNREQASLAGLEWARTLDTVRPIAPEVCSAREAVLYRSELGPEGARYSALERVSIGR